MDHRTCARRAINALLASVFAAYLAGCSFYHHPFETDEQQRAATNSPSAPELHIIQADDFGTLWDVAPAQQALNSINRQWPNTNVLVMVFIHGWHHNAAKNDHDLQKFGEMLRNVASEFGSPNRRDVRAALTGQPDVKIIGIYVGWRGRSLPSVLDYTTASWRKSAAQRVGGGDVSELLQRLQGMYRNANRPGRTAKDENDRPIGKDGQRRVPMMGLVTIGHSFGAQVLLQSVARSLEFALIQRAPCIADLVGSDARRPETQKEIDQACDAAKEDREEASQGRSEEFRPMESLGDLCILLNPALEAYQFQRIEALYRQVHYESKQTPQLIVFSAENDWARATLFPIQRATTLAFRPMFRGPNQGSLWGTALGELEGQRTHLLSQSQPPTTLVAESLTDKDYLCGDDDDADDSPTTDKSHCKHPLDFKSEDPRIENAGRRIREHDFTGETIFKNVILARNSTSRPVEHSPVAVVYTKKDIIDGHSGIFKKEFLEFLTTYIAFAEGKRFLWRARERQQDALLP